MQKKDNSDGRDSYQRPRRERITDQKAERPRRDGGYNAETMAGTMPKGRAAKADTTAKDRAAMAGTMPKGRAVKADTTAKDRAAMAGTTAKDRANPLLINKLLIKPKPPPPSSLKYRVKSVSINS